MIEHSLQNGLIQVSAPVEVGRNSGHFWFPSLHKVAETLVCAVIRSADVAQGKWPADLYVSHDEGATWAFDQPIDSYGHTSVCHDPATTLMMPYETWPLTNGDRCNATAPGTLLTSSGDSLMVEPREVRFLDFPFPLADYHEDELMLNHTGRIRRLSSGRLMTDLYGRCEGDTHLSSFAFVSQDDGFTWHYRATIADQAAAAVAGPGNSPGKAEGPNEVDTELLDGGDLLSVYRVSDSWDFCKSYSQDEGLTWSEPMRMEGMQSVQPRLCMLENEALILTGGRPGLFLWLSTDGRGDEWERLNLGEHHNRLIEDEQQRFSDAFCDAVKEDPAISTSYTAIMPCGPDRLIVAYDRLGNGWSGAPGPNGEVDRVFTISVTVSV